MENKGRELAITPYGKTRGVNYDLVVLPWGVTAHRYPVNVTAFFLIYHILLILSIIILSFNEKKLEFFIFLLQFST